MTALPYSWPDGIEALHVLARKALLDAAWDDYRRALRDYSYGVRDEEPHINDAIERAWNDARCTHTDSALLPGDGRCPRPGITYGPNDRLCDEHAPSTATAPGAAPAAASSPTGSASTAAPALSPPA